MGQRINRRQLIHFGTALAGMGICRAGQHTKVSERRKQTYREPARDVPIVEQADVVVCGAGPAGVTAAIAAARSGAKTRLLEANGCYRVTGNAVAMGQAAGVAAAIAAKCDYLPRDLSWEQVKSELARFNAVDA